ncbi:MAG: GH3 auxin-responsive promoter family protein [Candidatus Omnitrophota bacterium]
MAFHKAHHEYDRYADSSVKRVITTSVVSRFMPTSIQVTFKTIRLCIAHIIWAGLLWGRSRLFHKAATHLEKEQRDILLRLIRRQAPTVFGREHDFRTIKSINDFQSRVKLSTYDDYLPAIQAIAGGKSSVLTVDPVLMLEPSSGSTAGSKFIPYTQHLRDEFKNGLAPWLFDLFTRRPRLLLGSAYWSISPNTPKEWPGSKIPVGFGDDAGYFGAFEQRLVGEILSVPAVVSRIGNMEAYRYVTLLYLVRDRHLSFISVWNPTFLSLLMAPLPEWMPLLIRDINEGGISVLGLIEPELHKELLAGCFPDPQRARYLEGHGKADNLYEKIWPRLCLISCWADGHAVQNMAELENLFPNIEIQPKGLLATEGMISFPLTGKKGAALSICSHFFEFIEVDGPVETSTDERCIKLAHQLQEGMMYSVVITTGGGVYRYQLQDIIQVVGFKRQCPLIRFISKESRISDLVGEKLNEFHVAGVLDKIFREYCIKPGFYLLAPEKSEAGRWFYVLFLEFAGTRDLTDKVLLDLSTELEKKLEENYHYSHAIRLGQLLPVKVYLINGAIQASSIYLDACQQAGQKLGQIKPAVLSSTAGWSSRFRGRFL